MSQPVVQAARGVSGGGRRRGGCEMAAAPPLPPPRRARQLAGCSTHVFTRVLHFHRHNSPGASVEKGGARCRRSSLIGRSRLAGDARGSPSFCPCVGAASRRTAAGTAATRQRAGVFLARWQCHGPTDLVGMQQTRRRRDPVQLLDRLPCTALETKFGSAAAPDHTSIPGRACSARQAASNRHRKLTGPSTPAHPSRSSSRRHALTASAAAPKIPRGDAGGPSRRRRRRRRRRGTACGAQAAVPAPRRRVGGAHGCGARGPALRASRRQCQGLQPGGGGAAAAAPPPGQQQGATGATVAGQGGSRRPQGGGANLCGPCGQAQAASRTHGPLSASLCSSLARPPTPRRAPTASCRCAAWAGGGQRWLGPTPAAAARPAGGSGACTSSRAAGSGRTPGR